MNNKAKYGIALIFFIRISGLFIYHDEKLWRLER